MKFNAKLKFITAAVIAATALPASALVIESDGDVFQRQVEPIAKPSLGGDRRPIDLVFMTGVQPGEMILITQKGQSPGRAALTQTIGREARFIEAISQVLPSGWQVFQEGEIPYNRLVSWDGRNKSWAAVLNSLLNAVSDKNSTIGATIDWDTREILLEARKGSVKPSQFLVASEKQHAKTGPVFRLQPGMNLSDNLIEWGKKEGWKVLWLANVDYEVSTSRIYQGGFADEGGAVDQLISEYFNARIPLVAEFNANRKVVTVRSANQAYSTEPSVGNIAPAVSDTESIAKAIKNWSNAWSGKNMRAYFAAYASDYAPANMSRQAWEKERRRRIEGRDGKIDIVIEQPVITVDGNKAKARFHQYYSAAGIDSYNIKTLVFERRGGEWLIKDEIAE